MSENNECKKCSANCKVCSNENSCDFCLELYSINPSTKKCNECPNGSFSSQNVCIKCDNKCE